MNFLKWILFILTFVLVGCLPQKKVTECSNNEAYNASLRKCVPTLGAHGVLVTIKSMSPSFSYTVSNTSISSIIHQITVSDPYNNGFATKWYLHAGSGSTTTVGVNSLSHTLLPSTLTAGNYVLEVIVYNISGNEALDSRSWSINVTNAATPSYSSTSPAPVISKAITDTPFNFTVNVSNPDSVSGASVVWTVNGSTEETDVVATATSDTDTFNLDPSDYSQGTYMVQATLKKASTIYEVFTWTMILTNPAVGNINLPTSPASSSVVTAIDDISINGGGFLIGGAPTDFCLSTNDFNGSQGNGTYAQFFLDGDPIGGQINFVANNTNICLTDSIDLDIDLANPNIAESHTISVRAYDVDTSSELNNSPVAWGVSLRPQNTSPEIAVDQTNSTVTGCTYGGVGSTSGSACDITQDSSRIFAITVEDDDYTAYTGANINNFSVKFYLNGVLLDGSHPLSSSDCDHNYAYAGADKFRCSLTIRSYNSSGPVTPPSSYTITATVDDDGSPYTATTKTSNTVTWTIDTITESETAPYIGAQDTSGAVPVGFSYIANQSTPTTAMGCTPATCAGLLPATHATEGDNIVLKVAVGDAERDNYFRIIEMCPDATCTTSTVISSTTFHSRSNDDEYHESAFYFTLPESAVTGAARGTVYFRVTITDDTDVVAALNTQNSPTFGLNVANSNPIPVVADDSTLNQAGTYNVITGFPFSIDPGTITDASTADGVNLEYQWQIDFGAGWVDIDGATKKVLRWTPDASLDFLNRTGSSVDIRLCVGDDGFGNDVSTCPESTDTWTINVFSNLMDAPGNDGISPIFTPNGNVAIVHDTSSAEKVSYVAYSTPGGSALGYDASIVIEKVIYKSDGTIDGGNEFASVAFNTDTISPFAEEARDISMAIDDVNQNLYISYVSNSTLFSIPILHVRRLDISDGKLAMTTEQKFGFSYTAPVINTSGAITDAVGVDNRSTITFTGAVVAGNQVDIDNFTAIVDTDFCIGGCASTTDAAQELADLINNDASNDLQGFTAEVSGSTVILNGKQQDDYYDAAFAVTKAGKIMISGSKWYVPFLNSSLTGGNQNKVSVLSGNTGINLDIDNTNADIINTNLTTTTAQSSDIDNMIDTNGDFVVVTKTTSNTIHLIRFDNTWTLEAQKTNLFSSTSVSNIRLAAAPNATNNNIYVMAVVDASDKLALARVANGAVAANVFTSIVLQNPLDNSGLAQAQEVHDYSISAGLANNELFVGVVMKDGHSTAAIENQAYILKVKGSSPTVDCSYDNSQTSTKCTPLNLATDVTMEHQIALTPVISDVMIGDEGSYVGENENDSVFVAFHVDDGTTNPKVQTGILNIEAEAINATSVADGFNPPFVSGN